jgi:hypothetical protein
MPKQKTVGYILALLFLCSTCSSGTKERQVRFKLLRESVITVPLLVNGRGPFDFVFDTGSESSLIDSKLAIQLNISPVDRVVVFNPTGEKALTRGFADEISLGATRVLHTEVIIGDLDGLHTVSPRIRGIIGQNVLSHFDYVIDYAHSMIGFGSDMNLEEPISGMKTDVVRRHGCPVITGRISPGIDVQLSLDSGSSDLVLYRPKLPQSARTIAAQLQISSGAVDTRTAVIPRLQIGNVSVWGVRATVLDNSQSSEIDGLVPTRLFNAVYFNNREGYVILRPR